MILVHLLIALATFVAAFYQGIEFQDFYGCGVQFVQATPWFIYAWVIVVACLLVILMVLLEQIKFYWLMSLLSRVVFELSLLSMTILNLWAIFFGWKYLKNIWLDLLPFVLLPYLGLFVAIVMVQLFDFNYPYKKRVMLSVLLSGATVLLVFIHVI